jgi:hypothetical protein
VAETLPHLCDHPGCKVQIAHVHDEQGRIYRGSINWQYLDSLTDSGMKTAIGGNIAAFLNSHTPKENTDAKS